MLVKTKLAKIVYIYFFLYSKVVTMKCSASQRLVKYILFKITVCRFGTQNFMVMNIILAQ